MGWTDSGELPRDVFRSRAKPGEHTPVWRSRECVRIRSASGTGTHDLDRQILNRVEGAMKSPICILYI